MENPPGAPVAAQPGAIDLDNGIMLPPLDRSLPEVKELPEPEPEPEQKAPNNRSSTNYKPHFFLNYILQKVQPSDKFRVKTVSALLDCFSRKPFSVAFVRTLVALAKKKRNGDNAEHVRRIPAFLALLSDAGLHTDFQSMYEE